jgi:hypothetical protein
MKLSAEFVPSGGADEADYFYKDRLALLHAATLRRAFAGDGAG